MRFLKYLFKSLTIVCYIVILIAAITLAPCLLIQRPLVVLTPSMTGTYDKGSLVYVKNITFEELNVGDVITYETDDGNLVTHRIVTKQDSAKFVLTKGDANTEADSAPVFAKQITGRVSFGLPFAGYFIMFVQQIYVIVTLAVILIANIIFNVIYNRVLDKRERQKEQSVQNA